jgi:hypothetical protein
MKKFAAFHAVSEDKHTPKWAVSIPFKQFTVQYLISFHHSEDLIEHGEQVVIDYMVEDCPSQATIQIPYYLFYETNFTLQTLLDCRLNEIRYKHRALAFLNFDRLIKGLEEYEQVTGFKSIILDTHYHRRGAYKP